MSCHTDLLEDLRVLRRRTWRARRPSPAASAAEPVEDRAEETAPNVGVSLRTVSKRPSQSSQQSERAPASAAGAGARLAASGTRGGKATVKECMRSLRLGAGIGRKAARALGVEVQMSRRTSAGAAKGVAGCSWRPQATVRLLRER